MYENEKIWIQVNKSIKTPWYCKLPVFIVFMILAICLDYASIISFEDLILVTDTVIAKILTFSILFCIDLIAPVILPTLVRSKIKIKRLKTILAISLISSIVLPMLLVFIQKICGTEIMMPNDINSMNNITIPEGVKYITQILYAVVPITTTVALTSLSFVRDDYKIFKKYRYVEIAKERNNAQNNCLKENMKIDLLEYDNKSYISCIEELINMRNMLFTQARNILIKKLSDPAKTDILLQSRPNPELLHTEFDELIRENNIKKISPEKEKGSGEKDEPQSEYNSVKIA